MALHSVIAPNHGRYHYESLTWDCTSNGIICSSNCASTTELEYVQCSLNSISSNKINTLKVFQSCFRKVRVTSSNKPNPKLSWSVKCKHGVRSAMSAVIKVGNLGPKNCRYGTVQAKNVSFGLLTSSNLSSWKAFQELACKLLHGTARVCDVAEKRRYPRRGQVTYANHARLYARARRTGSGGQNVIYFTLIDIGNRLNCAATKEQSRGSGE